MLVFFLNKIFIILFENLPQKVFIGPFVTWCQRCDKPVAEQMMNQFTDA